MPPTPALSDSVVAVFSPDEHIVGAGVLIRKSVILTCLHVITKAKSGRGGKVRIRFHRTGDRQTATVVKVDKNNDLALLQLSADAPEYVKPVTLGDSTETDGQPFHAFGYPNTDTDGLMADGIIVSSTARGKNDEDLLQLRSSQLAQGFSGGPIEVNGNLVGIVTAVYHADADLKNIDTAWATPIERAYSLAPELTQLETEIWPLGHSYAASPNFTGRENERKALSKWLSHGPTVLVLRALGGFGKSALVWYWLTNDLDETRWSRAVWWSFYDSSSFESFLTETLPYFGVDPRNLGSRKQADELLRNYLKTHETV